MKLRRVFITALIISLLSVSAWAADAMESFGAGNVESALPDSAKAAFGDYGVGDAPETGFEKLKDYILSALSDQLDTILVPVVRIVIIACICAVADGLAQGSGGLDYVNFGGCVGIALIAVQDVRSLVSVGAGALGEMWDFTRALLPALCTAATAAGAYTSAAAKYAASCLFIDFLVSIANGLIFPLISAYTACVIADSAIASGRLSGAAGFIKWACTFIMGAMVTVFCSYLSISGIAASGADGAVVKAAKTTVSAVLPVVGNIISGAAGSIISGAGIVRNSMGIFGLLSTAAVCVLPFLQMGIRYILFRAASIIAESVAGARMQKLIKGIGDAYAMLLGLVGTGAVFVFFSIISMIKTVGG